MPKRKFAKKSSARLFAQLLCLEVELRTLENEIVHHKKIRSEYFKKHKRAHPYSPNAPNGLWWMIGKAQQLKLAINQRRQKLWIWN